ncbi:hypothetical protein BG003_008793 [Podila horticola]|nr:hypothetical protein BG003_008793 [Podila horticola]
MFNLFSHPTFHSGIPAHRRSHSQQQHQQQGYYPHTFDMFFNPDVNYNNDDEDDSEEQCLRAALEHKQQQRLFRQQYLRQHQELAEQQRIEQERALLERQHRARAATQAKHEAEQETVRQYQLRQRQLKEQQRAQMEQKRKQAEPGSLYPQQQEEDPLAELISSMFMPFIRPYATEQATQSQVEVKTNNDSVIEAEAEQDQEPADQEFDLEQETKAEQGLEPTDQEVDLEQETVLEEDPVGDYYAANPEIKSLVETLLGTQIENREIETLAEISEDGLKPAVEIPVEAAEAPEPTQSATESITMPDTAPSSVHSSPELRAADILLQREQRLLSIDKHAQLDTIESALNNLSLELQQIIAGTITTKNQILATEEHLTKAMFRIDAVECAGDSGIRRRRKELIKRSQELLEHVDDFKGRESGRSKFANVTKAVSDSAEESEPTQKVHETVEEQDTDTDPEPDEAGDEASDIDELSDIESLPDIESDAPEGHSLPESSGESGQEQQQEQEERQEQGVVDPLDHLLSSVFTLARSAMRDQGSIFRDLDSIFA